MFEIVSATRMPPADFWSKSALGLSLSRLIGKRKDLRARIAFANRKGLPEVYNSRILAKDCADAIAFVHDDVWIEDSDFVERVLEGLERYNVIGVAGCRRRRPFQPSWAFDDFGILNPVSRTELSGSIAHGPTSPGRRIIFGEWPLECELLDGVFLAADVAALKRHNVLFDPQFKFHFYDMDFCRSVRANALSMGTWPVNLTHQSKGAFGTDSWSEQYRHYLAKWEQLEGSNNLKSSPSAD